jgi:hypothetical protein
LAKDKTEYRVANYAGGLSNIPEPADSGSLEIKPDGQWKLNIGLLKHTYAPFARMPFEVEPLSPESCRVTIRSVTNASFGARLELPDTSAAVLEADLLERGYDREKMMAGAAERQRLKASGQWWAELQPYRVLIACHYSEAHNKSEAADLHATAEGLQYRAIFGSKLSIPWNTIQDIEVTTQARKRVTASRAIALGALAYAAKKSETYTYVHISDENTVWTFVSNGHSA